ncbi:hypothetical protein ACFY2W_32090 [Streptomyces sp. NPDC001262]|uniref:hypothetical protein n=1 Tax=Streptomyces sp. NPDC001262 TaxID=3364552 RepID=UPI00369F6031
MPAAAALPRVRNPLANSAGAFRNFGSALGQAARSVQTSQRAIASSSRVLDRVKQSATQAGTGIKQFGTGATTAGRAAQALGKQAGTANSGLLKTKNGSRQSARLLKNIKRQSDTAAKSLALLGKGAGKAGAFAGKLGGSLKIAGSVMNVVNLVMKTNPFVLLITLLAPFAEQLIEFALNSELGQQLMEQVFTTVGSLIDAAPTVIVPVVTAYLTVVIGFWKGVFSVVKPVAKWVGQHLPGAFRKVSSAMEGALHGMGGFLRTAFQAVAGVVKGPISGLIGFANWVIDGLNSISVNILGKKFGIHLPKIPMLAQGGVVRPRDGGVPVILAEAGEAEAVLPLSKLDRLLAQTAEAARATTTTTAVPRIDHYYEPAGRGSHGIAADLLFLAQVRQRRQTLQTRR